MRARSIPFAVAVWLAAVGAANSADITAVNYKDGKTRLNLVGEIQPGDVEVVKTAISNANNQQRLVVTIRLNSPGGNILEAAKIADVVRNAKMATAVLSGSTCASACFIIFAAGTEKYADYSAMVGVHGASDPNGNETAGSESATVTMARMVRELGVPANIIGKMVVTPPDQMVWLVPDDLRSMGTSMLGKPSQLSSTEQPHQLLQSQSPTSILPDAQASRTPSDKWSEFIEGVAKISARQNGGQPRLLRSCQPQEKVCIMGIWFKKDGHDVVAKVVKDLSDKVISREVCEFNEFNDVRQCLNWDTQQTHRDMKDPKGDWYKVSE